MLMRARWRIIIVYHYQGKEIVGITVIGAKNYGVKEQASSGLEAGLA